MLRILCSAVLLLSLGLSEEKRPVNPAATARCFYGRSNSYSSRETALNGEIFVMMATQDGKEATFKIVFHHRLKFYKTVVNSELGRKSTELKGHFAIDGAKVGFRMDLKDGSILGELGNGLDKGVITLEDFDTLVGRGDDSRSRARSGEAVFPDIKPAFRAVNLQWIDAYCRQRGIRRLDRDRVRLFTQPMGVVGEAIEIDFASRQLTVYPGTHSKSKISQAQLDQEQIAQIRALVTSEKFKKIPRENKKMGRDGTSYLLEVSIGDAYSWKLHWRPDHEELNKVVAHIRSVARQEVTEPAAPADADKPRR